MEVNEKQGQGSIYVLPLKKENEEYEWGLIYLTCDVEGTCIGVGYWNVTTKDFEIDGLFDSADRCYHFSGNLITNTRMSFSYIYII